MGKKSPFPTRYPIYKCELEKLFKESWPKILEKYESAWSNTGNLPYTYGEQPDIGLLAIAAWEIKAFPFIEFWYKKDNKTGIYAGRTDLEILWKGLGRKKADWLSGVEAKRAEVSCSAKRNDKDLAQTIEKHLNKAAEDVHSLTEYYPHYYNRLALVFGRLEEVSDDFDRERFSYNLFSAAWQTGADFCSIHFCDDGIRKKTKEERPGIAIIGKFDNSKY
jgi:hypothetical protein